VDDLNPTGYPQVVEELQGGVVTRQYTYGLQRIDENQPIANVWTVSFYGYDGGGNVRQLTSSSGAVTDTYEYDAFGNALVTTGSTPNEFLYRGEQYDSDLGLYYLRARYYNPLTGSFMSRDPEDHALTDVREVHKYLYAGGDPVNGIDPNGRGGLEHAVILFALYVAADTAYTLYKYGDCLDDFITGIVDKMTNEVHQVQMPPGLGQCISRFLYGLMWPWEFPPLRESF
jgi:RHS repeat-associated protein